MDLQQLKNLVIFHATQEHEAGCDPIQTKYVRAERFSPLFEKTTIVLNSPSTIKKLENDCRLVLKFKHQPNPLHRPLYWV